MKPKKKIVKAWTVYSKKDDGISDMIFTLKQVAKRYYETAWQVQKLEFPHIPEHRLKLIRKNYKIIPVEIHLPVTKKKVGKR